jgi:putative ABC transport system permease protein
VGATVVIGLAVPLLFALGPVLHAARITVQQALHDDPGPRGFGARDGDRWLTRLPWLPRPLLLSLRATFARRGRLALTVGTLAVGGAVFMSALNVASAWTRDIDAEFARRRYDLTVVLAEAWPVAALDQALAGVPGVVRAEYWPGASPYLIGASGVPGRSVSLVGPTPGSTLLDPRLVAGRWLRADDPSGAVINGAVLTRNPGLALGDTVRVRLRGRTVGFPIVGIVRELAPMPVVYAASSAVLEATGQSGEQSRLIRVVSRDHDDAGQRAVARDLERAFESSGIEVRALHRTLDQRQGIVDHLVIIKAILTMASLVVVFVGAIALAGTLTLSVVQRTREIGILGAIGASPGSIARHVWAEGVLIGLLSWGVAVLLAAPLSWALEVATGSIFFKTPLDFHMSPAAAGVWLALVVVLATLSSFYPARRAARLTVREAMSHT